MQSPNHTRATARHRAGRYSDLRDLEWTTPRDREELERSSDATTSAAQRTSTP
jgi:hypothetical protein